MERNKRFKSLEPLFRIDENYFLDIFHTPISKDISTFINGNSKIFLSFNQNIPKNNEEMINYLTNAFFVLVGSKEKISISKILEKNPIPVNIFIYNY